jgi:hypothetical protein
MRKYLNIFKQALIFLVVITIQLGFISSLKVPFYNIPVLLIFVSFFVIFQKDNKFLYWVVFIGFLLDVCSFDVFGFFMVSFVISSVILKFIQINFLTTKSFYSILSLNSLFILFFNIIFRFLSMFVSFFAVETNWFLFSFPFWRDIFFQLIFNFLITSILFYFTKLTTKKFSSGFLKSK